MLQGRLTRSAALAAAAIGSVACAGIDGTERGAIREAVIEPGITAIDDASGLACDADAATLRTALDTYATLEGEPAADEAALVDGGYLRQPSELWDVAAGELVPQHPDC